MTSILFYFKYFLIRRFEVFWITQFCPLNAQLNETQMWKHLFYGFQIHANWLHVWDNIPVPISLLIFIKTKLNLIIYLLFFTFRWRNVWHFRWIPEKFWSQRISTNVQRYRHLDTSGFVCFLSNSYLYFTQLNTYFCSFIKFK